MKYKTSIELYNDECVKVSGWKSSFISSLKLHAIDFAKWINDNGWQEYDESDRWIQPHNSDLLYSTEQIYNMFNKSAEPETISSKPIKR